MRLGLSVVNYFQIKYAYNHVLEYINLGVCVFKEKLNFVIENFTFREDLKKNFIRLIHGDGSIRVASLIKK